jgi:K+/H+ antiporter YhaU regulatory subunit KhtT
MEEASRLRRSLRGLTLDWLVVKSGYRAADRSIKEAIDGSDYPASVMIVLRGDTVKTAPESSFVLEADDTIVAVGSDEGIKALFKQLRS